jgi:hypothetical protein
MNDLDTRLEQALKAGDPAPRDPMFRIEVLLRRHRTVVRQRLLAAAVMALAAAIFAAVGFAALGEWAPPGPERLVAVAVAGAALTALLVEPHVGALSALWRIAGRWWTRA